MDRFRHLRRRRIARWTAVAAAVSVAALVLPLMLVGSGGPSQRLVQTAPTKSSPPAKSTTTVPATTVPATTVTTGAPTTSTTTSRPTRTTTKPAIATTTLAPATTTTIPQCSDAQYSYQLGTDSTYYNKNQIVYITATITNEGPTCQGGPPWSCGQKAWVDNSSGTDVWDSGATPVNGGPTNCPAFPSTNQHGSSDTQTFQWQQDNCTFDPGGTPGTPNPNCPQSPVPGGQYTVHSGNAEPVTITLAA